MKKLLLPFAAVLLLVGCNNDDGSKNPEEAMQNLEDEKLGDDPTLSENDSHESDNPNDTEGGREYLTKDFLNQISQGEMPHSEIQLGATEEEVRSAMGEPQTEEEIEGANYLVYEKYAYGIDENGDVISVVYHVPESDNAKLEEFGESWGGNAQEGLFYDAPGTRTITYDFANGYRVHLRSNEEDKVVDAIFLMEQKDDTQ